MRTRVLVADEHEAARKALKDILQNDSRYEVCGEAIDGLEAAEKVRALKPDAVIDTMDVIQAVREIRATSPSTKIIIVSIYDSAAIAQMAAMIGADAFLTKTQCGLYLNRGCRGSAGRARGYWSSNSLAISSASSSTDGFLETDFSLAAIFCAARCEHR